MDSRRRLANNFDAWFNISNMHDICDEFVYPIHILVRRRRCVVAQVCYHTLLNEIDKFTGAREHNTIV